MILIILSLALGVGLVCWLLWIGAQIRHNTRGHRLGRWMGIHASAKHRASSWWRSSSGRWSRDSPPPPDPSRHAHPPLHRRRRPMGEARDLLEERRPLVGAEHADGAQHRGRAVRAPRGHLHARGAACRLGDTVNRNPVPVVATFLLVVHLVVMAAVVVVAAVYVALSWITYLMERA